jgi:rare lipoprotein A
MRTFARCLVALLFCLTACSSEPPEPVPAPPAQASETPTFSQTGGASWYGPDHDGKVTANGEHFDMHEMTAAHRSLAFGTIVRVHSAATGRMVKVRINDRGPFEKRRIIDLSAAAAEALGIHEKGVASVHLDVFASDQGKQDEAAQGEQRKLSSSP